jgi:peptide/nickel transport system permease protein
MSVAAKSDSRGTPVIRRFFKNKFTLAGFVIFAFLVIIACTADIFFDYNQQALKQNAQQRFLGFSAEHPFGTDQYGRDVFVRIMYGARISLVVAFSTAAFGLIFGTVIGAVAGYTGGWVDILVMRFMDVLLAIPSMLLAICIVAAFGSGLFNLILANGIAHIPRYSRIVRSQILSIKELEFIEASRACGASAPRIIVYHIIPNLLGQLIVQATLTMALSILSVASLSFIGLGIQPPTPEWGSMLSTGKEFMRQYPHLIVFPGLSIMLATLSFNLIGDGLRDALDPRLNY